MGSTSTSSSSKISCFQCEETSSSFDHFRNGWRLRSGEFAQLCPRCASIYEEGKFCEAFHSNDDGWRDCESCGKLVHCGCIVSFNAYLLLDFGGVICMECSRINFALARSRCLFLESQQDITRQTLIDPQYRPRSSDMEIQQISRNSECVVTPLFEKLLSATDADLKLARLIIPKKCAEIFLSHVDFSSKSRTQKAKNGILTIVIGSMEAVRCIFWKGLETLWFQRDGKQAIQIIVSTSVVMKDSGFQSNERSGGKLLHAQVLGNKLYQSEKERGNIIIFPGVTFYRVEPGGKLVIGLRKTSLLQPSNEK